MPAVLVKWEWDGNEAVYELSETHATTFGGSEHDIDLELTQAYAELVDGPAGWLLRRLSDGTEQTLAHGDGFQLHQHRFRFLIADDVPRALDEDRYLRTVIDPLTDVFNRRFLYVQAPRVGRAALLLLDLDWFMSFNDQHGHLMGDVVLQKIAARLREALRWPEIVVRYGGEEFIVVLPGHSLAQAVERAETIRQQIDVPLDIDGEAPLVTVSIGVALIGTGDDALDTAIRAADANLILAKERGRNRVVG